MNMMARGLPGGVLVDPYGGADDVAARRIDILRAEAFVDDPLRMLRACQFAARFQFELSAVTLDAMRAAAPLVASVSPERIRDELVKFLERAERPSIGIELMREGGLLPFVLPEVAEGVGVAQNRFHAYDVFTHSLVTLDAAAPGDLPLRLAALFHDVGKPRAKTVDDGEAHFYRHEVVGAEMTSAILERLRFPGEVASSVTQLVRHHMYAADPAQEPKTLRRFVRRIGADQVERQFALRHADIVGSGLPERDDSNERFEARVRDVMAERPPLDVRDLAIGGVDAIHVLVEAGLRHPGSRGGPEVGRLLGKLVEVVLDAPERNTRAELLELAKTLAPTLR
jgi:putative nucleotidyltransferase with HDIG domain